MAVVFLTSTVIAVLENPALKLDFWSLAGAAETASWRLKFVAMPVSIFSLWVGIFLYRSIGRGKGRFAGIGLARTGLALSLLVTVLFVTTIAITIPARLKQQEDGQRAGENAKLYALKYALLKYQSEYNTFAWQLDNLTNNGIEDPDGSIAKVVEELKKAGATYTPRSDLAATLPKSKIGTSKGVALRSASASRSDDSAGQVFSATSYELRLPGPDKLLGTADDLRMVNGVINPTTPDQVVGPNP
jgi:hypothetical protein